MRGLLITGAGDGIGKTLIGCALAFAAHARGLRAGVMKPVEAGCAEIDGALEPADARALIYAAASDLPIEVVCPYRYAGSAPNPVRPPAFDVIVAAYRKIAERSDLAIVEDTGGLSAAIEPGKDYAELARMLALEAIIVVGNRPGCVEAAMRTLDHASSRGVAIAGAVLNDMEPANPAMDANEAALARIDGIRFLGRVRFKQPVTRQIIDPLLASA